MIQRLTAIFLALVFSIAQAQAQLPAAPNQFQPLPGYTMKVTKASTPAYVPSWIGAHAITATTTLDDSADTLQTVSAAAGAVVVTLAPAIQTKTMASGHPLCFKAIDVSNLITVAAASGDTIDGAASVNLTVLNQCLILESDNTHTWRVITTGTGGGGGAVSSVSNGDGSVTVTPTTGAVDVSLPNTAVTPGSYTSVNATVDSKGRITSMSNGSGGGAVSSVAAADSTLTITPTTGAVTAKIPSSVALPGAPTTTTAAPGDNSTKIATTAFSAAANAALPINSATVPDGQFWGNSTGTTGPASFSVPAGLGYGPIAPQLIPKWRQAIAGVLNNTQSATLAVFGDSTVAGLGATTRAARFGQRLQALLNLWIPCTEGIVWCQNQPAGLTETRFTLGTGWSTPYTIGPGLGFEANTGATGDFTFAPGYSFDRITVFYYGGTCGVNIGGANLATLNSATLTKTVISCTPGTNTVHFSGSSVSGQIYICGVMCSTSTVNSVQLTTLGQVGTTLPPFVDNTNPAFSALSLYPQLGANLLAMDCTINDATLNTPVATWNTAMVTLTSAVNAAGGDCVVVTGIPGALQAPHQLAYQNQARATASAQNDGFIDLIARWVSVTVSAPLFYSDNVHANDLGQTDEAAAFSSALRVAY